MRDLPPPLQINALVCGAVTGALMPLLMMSLPEGDADVAAALAASAPATVEQARKMADAMRLP